MITSPRRSVTRFFIPLIDVLILLLTIFLLMPFVSAPATAEPDAENKAAPPDLPIDLKDAQQQLAEARRRLNQLERERTERIGRLSVTVLEMSTADADRVEVTHKGRRVRVPALVYYSPDRRLIKSRADADAVISVMKQRAGNKDVHFVIRFPRDPNFPHPTLEDQDAYADWFKNAPPGYEPLGT